MKEGLGGRQRELGPAKSVGQWREESSGEIGFGCGEDFGLGWEEWCGFENVKAHFEKLRDTEKDY